MKKIAASFLLSCTLIATCSQDKRDLKKDDTIIYSDSLVTILNDPPEVWNSVVFPTSSCAEFIFSDSIFKIVLMCDSSLFIQGDTVLAVKAILRELVKTSNENFHLQLKLDTAITEYYKKVYLKEPLTW